MGSLLDTIIVLDIGCGLGKKVMSRKRSQNNALETIMK
jgi:hypothetical protein